MADNCRSLNESNKNIMMFLTSPVQFFPFPYILAQSYLVYLNVNNYCSFMDDIHSQVTHIVHKLLLYDCVGERVEAMEVIESISKFELFGKIYT